MRLLLISNSGTPFLEHCREHIQSFLGQISTVHYITAARLDDESARFKIAAEALSKAGIRAVHFRLDEKALQSLDRAQAVFVSGGNTYALLSRLYAAGLLEPLRKRISEGLSYIGTSAGTNIAGRNIKTTNDWNVVGALRFDAMNLVPWSINPHYRESDPTAAPGSETRDQRIAEYLHLHDNPVLGIEEETAVQVLDSEARIVGRGRAKLFSRSGLPQWFSSGERILLLPNQSAANGQD